MSPRTFVPFGLLLLLCLAGVGLREVGIAFNFTPSLPLGAYVQTSLPLTRGTLVSVCVAEEAAREARELDLLAAGRCPGGVVPLLKRIAAVEGDVVEITAEGVFVSDRLLQFPAPKRSARGHRLRTWPLGRYDVKPGELWLTAKHPRSWDSRYFGPVEAASVVGTYRPLWTWDG